MGKSSTEVDEILTLIFESNDATDSLNMIGAERCLHVFKVLKSGNSLDEITEIVSILYDTNSLVEDKMDKNLASDGDQIEKRDQQRTASPAVECNNYGKALSVYDSSPALVDFDPAELPLETPLVLVNPARAIVLKIRIEF
ncbi:hypothetical protein PI124_g1253 [Phytophthora idaei]|nr:hypothetical protein PI125_g9543 [Phytophthora idaei]KAG3173589.1 hypothetical protein PI126_g769 [Phytophthora idaei]KAG3254181.1 hypothetical protein PI124_g1253 [Phytophthora idaei]